MSQKQLCTKTKYATQEFAKAEIVRISKISNRSKVPQREYYCGKCGGWHITSKPNPLVEKVQELLAEITVLKQNHKIEINQYKQQISNWQSSENKVLRKEIKKDEMYTILQNRIKNQNETIRRLRKDNEELLIKNLKLQK